MNNTIAMDYEYSIKIMKILVRITISSWASTAKY